MLKIYEAVLSPCKNGYDVVIPDLNATTWGEDLGDAVAQAYDAMVSLCAAMLDGGRTLPPTTWGHVRPDGGHVIALCADVRADAPEETWMCVADAASILGVSAIRVRAMARTGVLRARKTGDVWEISVAAVRERQANPPRPGRPRSEAAL